MLKTCYIITLQILTEVLQCADGDTKLDEDGIPYLFWDDVWSPICGHYFWNNQDGAKAFCKKLGFTGGVISEKNIQYKEDAIQVGKCNSGETIDSCKAQKNLYTNTESCEAGYLYDGKHIGLTISCNGHTAGSEIHSCTGKIHNEKYMIKLQYIFALS